jgi:hypothetical protein
MKVASVILSAAKNLVARPFCHTTGFFAALRMTLATSCKVLLQAGLFYPIADRDEVQ